MKKRSDISRSDMKTIALVIALIILVLFFLAEYVIYPVYLNNWQFTIYGGMTDDLKDCELYEDMRSGKSFCFMGDSITYGTYTNNLGWYQPLVKYIKGNVSNLSLGGWKVLDLIDQRENIPETDIYVIAIGINDILFPGDERSSQTVEEFTDRLTQLSDIINEISPDSKIYFVSPWTFLTVTEYYNERGIEFRSAFSEWCRSLGYIYLDADTIILSVLESDNPRKYMHNEFHPNSPKGLGLFSYAVLKADHDRRTAG